MILWRHSGVLRGRSDQNRLNLKTAANMCGQYCDTFLEMEVRIQNSYPMDRIGCSYVASCKWGMTTAKIRLLFAVFSVCFVIFYFRSVSSCSASSSDDCTKRARESYPDSYLGFCVCSTNKRQGLQICVVIQYLALPRSMIVAIEQISFIGWNSCIPRTFLF